MVSALVAGAVVAFLQGGPILFKGFRRRSSFAISAVIEITAGLSTADDTGRRYLIGVSAAVQLAIFPVWMGAALVLGLPSPDIVESYLTSFSHESVHDCRRSGGRICDTAPAGWRRMDLRPTTPQ
jgi:hypothetical protein